MVRRWCLAILIGVAAGWWAGSRPGWAFQASSPDLAAIVAVLQADPRNVNALNAYGIEQARAGDLIGAIRTWRYAIDLAPRYVHLYNNIGSALRRLGHLKDARDWYQASLRLQATYWTWYNLGLLQEEMGNLPEAQQSYWEAVRLFPAFMAARERYLRVERLRREAPAAPRPGPVAAAKPPVPIMPEAEPVRATVTAVPRPAPVPAPRATGKPSATEALTEETPAREYEQVRLPGDAGGQVFLTFDGGADADGVEPILAALAARGVRSTFFLTGQWVKSFPDLARRILAEGHEIANHSMSHKNMAGWGKEAIAAELEKAEAVFVAVTGRRGAPFFRFPFGAQNARVERLTEELGYRPVYWTIDTIDWQEPPVQRIIDKVTTRIRRGAVVLMHVGGRNGPKALPAILDHLLARGYRPDKLSALDPSQIASLPTIGG